MTFGSLFAGIGGLDLGLERSGFRCLWQAEKDEACRRVLSRHWPKVKRIDDVRKVNSRQRKPDLISGGFPCQDLSVAGKRAGLAGERSGLFHEFVRVLGVLAPQWVLVENVPGLLSSNGGRDMGTVLGALGQLGYGWAYRVLDAQYFGVTQRRRRVFIVGCLGDAARAASVLFEPESCDGDSAPGREAWARTAACLRSRSAKPGVSEPGRGGEDDINLAFTELGEGHQTYQPAQQAASLRTNSGGGGVMQNLVARCDTAGHGRRYDADSDDFVVTHTLRSEGCDAGEDGTGGGTPLAVAPIDMRQCSRGETMTNNRKDGASGGPPGTGIGKEGDPSPSLAASHPPAIAFQERGREGGRNLEFQEEQAYALLAPTGGARTHEANIQQGMSVRRLTPRECERLQGFPDDWTAGEKDTARYRMLGNAVCVPVAEWIGRRIMAAQ